MALTSRCNLFMPDYRNKMGDDNMKSAVDAYLEKQKSPLKEICMKLRSIILRTCPKIKEEMEMGVPWYEGKFYIAALKYHVNIGFSVSGLSVKEAGLFDGKGRLMRHLQFRSTAEMDEKKIEDAVKLVAKKARCEPCG